MPIESELPSNRAELSADIAELIARSYGAANAQTYRDFVPSSADQQALAFVGKELLTIFPNIPAACIMMSALYALQMQSTTGHAAYVVAGALWVGQIRIFGEDTPLNGSARFSQSSRSWDGHAWVMFGSYIADVSLFRTAYSQYSHPVLAAHVLREFGPGRGLMIVRDRDAANSGITYVPQYVLNEEQLMGVAQGALGMISR
ncbi:MAG: hypothetical protein P4L76_15335 [Beijerinckiaceae bacterium]|nr:hypothetical protein [Beijerinckiaceae bacterium]